MKLSTFHRNNNVLLWKVIICKPPPFSTFIYDLKIQLSYPLTACHISLSLSSREKRSHMLKAVNVLIKYFILLVSDNIAITLYDAKTIVENNLKRNTIFIKTFSPISKLEKLTFNFKIKW